MQSLTILGRRWFDRANGNTYHSVTVLIDGKKAWGSGMTYGYGDQYIWTAAEWLNANGHLPDYDREPLSLYCREHGIEYYCQVSDGLKRDL